MRSHATIASTLCLLALTACNDNPQIKVEKAQQQQIEAQTEANKKQAKAASELEKAQTNYNEAAAKAAGTIQEGQEKVQKANENMAKVQAEIDQDRVEAQDKLTKRLQNLDERMAKIHAAPPKIDPDPAKQTEYTQKMELAHTNLEDARAKVGHFATVLPEEWKGAYQSTSDALDKAEQSVESVD